MNLCQINNSLYVKLFEIKVSVVVKDLQNATVKRVTAPLLDVHALRIACIAIVHVMEIGLVKM